MITAPRYLTTEELADRLRTSPSTARYWRHTNQGPRSFKAGRRVLYSIEEVEKWERELQDQQYAATPDGAA